MAAAAAGGLRRAAGGRRAAAPRGAAAAAAAALPRVYAYDHCPYCVRVRLGMGLKGIKHELRFMANDDVETPTALLGKKIAPILEEPDSGLVMGESMDIVKKFDEDPAFGPQIFGPASGRKDIKAWMKGVKDLLRLLHRPRYMQANLPEFQQKDSRDYFIGGHPVPPFDKPEWKAADFPATKKEGEYAAAMARTAELVPELNAALAELEGLIYSEDFCTEGGLSLDDIDLWSRLRSVTLVKGAQFGPKTMAYLKNLEAKGDVPLYFSLAC